MRLYLVRHGQTAWNAELKAQGHTDIPLDPQGREQAELLGRSFAEISLAEVLSSDLCRSAETAAPIARSCEAALRLDEALRERSFGQYEGLPFSEVTQQMARRALECSLDPYEVCPPGGESMRDVWERLSPVLDLIRESQGPLALVTHGGTCGLLLARLVQGTLATARSFRFANTGVTELERRPDGTFAIVRYNDTAHLQMGRALSGSVDGATR
jgi:2,3-bisphosphoglycerate-dependent phosphoglycerate mutase